MDSDGGPRPTLLIKEKMNHPGDKAFSTELNSLEACLANSIHAMSFPDKVLTLSEASLTHASGFE